MKGLIFNLTNNVGRKSVKVRDNFVKKTLISQKKIYVFLILERESVSIRNIVIIWTMFRRIYANMMVAEMV